MTPRLAGRLRKVAQVGGAQVLVQALGFAAALLLVRGMAPQEYALLALAMAAIATGAVLADLGLATGVLARAGQVGAGQAEAAPGAGVSARAAIRAGDRTGSASRSSRPAIGPAGPGVLRAARAMQRPWLVALALIGAPVLMAALLHHHATPSQATLLALLALAAAALQARNGLALALVRLAGDVGWLQRTDLLLALLRLAAVALALALGLAAAGGVAVQAAGAALAALLLAWWLRVSASGPAVTPGPGDAAALRSHVWRQGPNTVWFVVSSQVSLWAVALLGSAQQVAEVGALARLAALFAVVAVLVSTLAQPYFARPRPVAELQRALRALHGAFALLAAALVAAAWVVPGPLLALLGADYAGVGAALPWAAASALLGSWSGAVYAVGCARGWVLPTAAAVGATLAGTAAAVLLTDLSTTLGATVMQALAAAASLVACSLFVHHRLRHAASGGEEAPRPRTTAPARPGVVR
jgi:O-antigen/teichoic acid export membrane protein